MRSSQSATGGGPDGQASLPTSAGHLAHGQYRIYHLCNPRNTAASIQTCRAMRIWVLAPYADPGPTFFCRARPTEHLGHLPRCLWIILSVHRRSSGLHVDECPIIPCTQDRKTEQRCVADHAFRRERAIVMGGRAVLRKRFNDRMMTSTRLVLILVRACGCCECAALRA